MKTKRIYCIAINSLILLTIIATSHVAFAQVVDLPRDEPGGRFLDTRTGLEWMDIYDFESSSFSVIATRVAGSGFRFATRSEVASLLTGVTLFNLGELAGGVRAPCSICRVIGGVYDDRSSGTNAAKTGLGALSFAFFGNDEQSILLTDDAVLKLAPPDRVPGTNGAFLVKAAALPPEACINDTYHRDDLDGDGLDDKVVWRPEFGMWYVRLSQDDTVFARQWGLPKDHPILSDYDGDCISDLVVWRPSTGIWYVLRSSNGFQASLATLQQFGLPGDIPQKSDFDGDGRLDYSVWRPSEGNHYSLLSATGQVMVTQWGLAGDIPVAGK